jgi:CheY-like chemotaxis protein
MIKTNLRGVIMPALSRKFLSVVQIAEYCHVPEAIVSSWISKGMMGANLKKKEVLLDDFISFIYSSKFEAGIVSDTHSLKALVVDDEQNVANTIGEIFSSHGFKVLKSRDAIEAGCMIKHEVPNIVTVDLTMKTFDGLDLLKIINGLEARKNIWVVVISGSDEEKLKESVDMGADCYLQKPFSHQDLEKLIHRFFPPTSAKAS